MFLGQLLGWDKKGDPGLYQDHTGPQSFISRCIICDIAFPEEKAVFQGCPIALGALLGPHSGTGTGQREKGSQTDSSVWREGRSQGSWNMAPFLAQGDVTAPSKVCAAGGVGAAPGCLPPARCPSRKPPVWLRQVFAPRLLQTPAGLQMRGGWAASLSPSCTQKGDAGLQGPGLW